MGLSRNTWVDSLPYGQRVTIKQYDDASVAYRRVTAGLPDSYGLSVGSSFVDPFNQGVGENSRFSSALTKGAGAAGISRKPGSMSTSIYYDSPEPTEISFELNFEAYYSARDEVINPVMTLMMMSLGNEMEYEELKSMLNEYLGQTGTSLLLPDTSEEWSAADRLTDRIGVIVGPDICRIRFGKGLVIDDCYISSVAPQFSNVVDNEFLPMSATVSVTAKLQRNPVQATVASLFRQSRGEY